MSIQRRPSPVLDGAIVVLGDGDTERSRHIFIDTGEYATPFWVELNSDAQTAVRVDALPVRIQRQAGGLRILSTDPATTVSLSPARLSARVPALSITLENVAVDLSPARIGLAAISLDVLLGTTVVNLDTARLTAKSVAFVSIVGGVRLVDLSPARIAFRAAALTVPSAQTCEATGVHECFYVSPTGDG